MEYQLALRQQLGGSSTVQHDKGQNYDPPLHHTQNTYTDYNVYTQPSAPPIRPDHDQVNQNPSYLLEIF